MKKLLSIVLLFSISFIFTACEPTTTQVSQITNITQATTVGTTTAYVPVTFIEIVADMQEVCQAAVVTLTVNVLPTNATNQAFIITMPANVMIDFVTGTNNLQVEVIGNPPTGTELGQVILTVTSDDNVSIDNTVDIYIYPDTFSPPQCELN